jgi:hypothetical protein
MVFVEEHPLLVPKTVYTVVLAGVSLIEAVVPPVFQL